MIIITENTSQKNIPQKNNTKKNDIHENKYHKIQSKSINYANDITLVKHSLTSGCATTLSRITGFIRDMITANLFGATIGYDAFILAFRIPNLMRRLFAEGAFSQAFVPILAEYIEKKNSNEVKLFIDKIASHLTLILSIVTIIGVLFAPLLIKIFAPGFSGLNLENLKISENHEKLMTATLILRIVFPYIFFISLTALAAGILNCYHKFIVPAFTPVLLNLSLIFCSLYLSKKIIPPELSLAIGVIIAGILQLSFQIPFLMNLNLLPKFKLDWQDTGIKKILLLMVPAILGAAISQINILIDSIFASFLTTGSITWLYYADRLMEFPLGIFGVSFATVILPQLSKSFANKNYTQFNKILTWGVKSALLVGVPSSIILFLLAEPIISSLFFTGKFKSYDVIMTSKSLMAYALAVTGIMLAKIFSSGFYAIRDLKTPLKIGGIILIANIILNSILTAYLGHIGIALSTSIVSILHAFMLYIALIKTNKEIKLFNLKLFYLKSFVSCLILASFIYMYLPLDINWLTLNMTNKIIKLSQILLLGLITYTSTLWLCGFRLKNMH